MAATSDDSAPTTGTGGKVGNTYTGAASHSRYGSNQEISNLIADVQDLLNRVVHIADPEIAQVRAKVERALATAKRTLADGTDRVQRQARNAMTAGDHYVRDNPWQVIGVVAAAGLIVGALVARRASRSRG
jgi:ElaB/YqjD/DUF883 family membrane-anchored ribosome-binding protein